MRTKAKDKIVVIGSGNVGVTIAYTLMLKRLSSDIVLIDVDEGRAEGNVLDMNHGIAFFRQLSIKRGTYEDCKDASIVIVTAGIARKPGQTRLELAQTNVKVMYDIAKQITQYNKDMIILVVSNPVDVLTYVARMASGLPAAQVIGSGTMLDTSRFRYLLSKHFDTDIRDINAYILGEHGDTQVPIWSSITIAGERIDEYCKDFNKILDREEIFVKTRDAGAEVINLKGATFYGVAMSVARVVASILEDEHTVLPVSHVLDEPYHGISDVAISLPCIVTYEGVKQVIDLHISSEEMEELRHSAQTMKTFLDKAILILEEEAK
ncbi:L-lactate dehydrogenase 1 [Christensenellaceae bacterium]|nr:L-lactate dehydrogenase 1 [Christensenellaceae bacterium]BDF61016.1 L-lactate dehydrogenase 1 [Christensenellaceae bacterium]